MPIRIVQISNEQKRQSLSNRLDREIPHRWLGMTLFQILPKAAEVADVLSRLYSAYPDFVRKDFAGRFDLAEELLAFLSMEKDWQQEPFMQRIIVSWQNFRNYDGRFSWTWGGRTFTMGDRPLVMGILNVTPDSFSDGGRFLSKQAAVEHALAMEEAGADILDIGGESTRPGAEPVSAEEELQRVIPVIESIRKYSSILISVDTYKSYVAREALKAGVDMVNDISGARFDPEMIDVVKSHKCPMIIMHIKGTPRDMQKNPYYEDVVEEVYTYFEERLEALQNQGIDKIIIDPGIGFGKRVVDNLLLLRDLREFTFLQRPILIGTSRKSFIGRVLNLDINERLFAGLATQLISVQNGAQIVRVHDVGPTRQALDMWQAVRFPQHFEKV